MTALAAVTTGCKTVAVAVLVRLVRLIVPRQHLTHRHQGAGTFHTAVAALQRWSRDFRKFLKNFWCQHISNEHLIKTQKACLTKPAHFAFVRRLHTRFSRLAALASRGAPKIISSLRMQFSFPR